MNEDVLNIGIVMDNPSFVEQLCNYFQNNSMQLITINTKKMNLVATEIIKQLHYEEKQIDCLIIYGHLGNGHRQNLEGLNWLRKFRLARYETPILLLVWERPSRIWACNFAENIFVNPHYKDSCRILQLPVSNEDLFNELLKIRNINQEELDDGISFSLRSWLHHRLSYICMIDDLQDAQAQIKKLKEGLPYSKKEVELLEQLLQCSNILNFKNLIENYLQRK